MVSLAIRDLDQTVIGNTEEFGSGPGWLQCRLLKTIVANPLEVLR
jgi:hypothetical protein